MGQPHKHAELIKAWADGAEIQCEISQGNWCDIGKPDWHEEVKFRIKPEPPKYPQTRMTDADLRKICHDNTRDIANAAIARAVQDGQVAILCQDGISPLSDPARAGDTSYCMEIIGQGRIFGTEKTIDYVANRLLDGPGMVPAYMLGAVAVEVRVDTMRACQRETCPGATPINDIIAKVKGGK